METNQHGVNLKEALANMVKEGIPFDQVTVFYSDLSPEEVAFLKEKDLFRERTQAVVLGAISADGEVLFPDKVSGFYSLSA